MEQNLPNSQTYLVIVHHKMSQLFWYFIYATACHLGQFEPSTKGLHDLTLKDKIDDDPLLNCKINFPNFESRECMFGL